MRLSGSQLRLAFAGVPQTAKGSYALRWARSFQFDRRKSLLLNPLH
jgi:hypothetical protein